MPPITKNDNPFKERSLNAHNVTSKPLETLYGTAEGFGKTAVPKNKADSKPASKENQEMHVQSSIEIKQAKNEPSKQPNSHRSKGSGSREFSQAEINVIKRGPIGPHQLKDTRQAAQNQTLDDPEMVIDLHEIDQVSQECHETTTTEPQSKALTSANPDFHAVMIAQKFKQRCLEQREKQMKSLIAADRQKYDDPQQLSEFSNDIYKCLLIQEV